MIDRRTRLRRLLEIELPILFILMFALAPYLWMVLTSVKPNEAISIIRLWRKLSISF